MRLLHLADVHLGARLGGFGPVAEERREAIRRALRALPARTEEWAIDAVVVAGDLFDGPRPARADLDAAREALRDLARDGRPVFVVPGNHDTNAGADSPWAAMPEGVTVLSSPQFGEPVSVTIGDESLHVYGIAYDPAVEPDPLAGFRRSADDGHHVVLLHAGTADHPDWTDGHGLRVTSAELAGLGADYVALGDHHAYRPPEAFADAPACYPGSFASVAVDELGAHGCVLVDLVTSEAPTVRLQASEVPFLADMEALDVGGLDDDLAVADRVGGLLGNAAAYPVVTLRGEPAFPLDAERIGDSLRERFGFAVVRDETRFIDSGYVQALATEPTIAGHVARLGLMRVAGADGESETARARHALRLALGALDVEA